MLKRLLGISIILLSILACGNPEVELPNVEATAHAMVAKDLPEMQTPAPKIVERTIEVVVTPTPTPLPTNTPVVIVKQAEVVITATPTVTPTPTLTPMSTATPTSTSIPLPTATQTIMPAAIPLTDIQLPTENEKSASINKTMTVFAIKVLVLEGVTTRDLKLVSNILAQWIDNDEDGIPDNPAVLNEIVRQNSRMIFGVTFDQIGPWQENSQKMLKDELAPTYGLDVTSINHNWYGLPLSTYSQDHYYRTDGLLPPNAATEETFHLLTDIGYENVYSAVFWRGIKPGTTL